MTNDELLQAYIHRLDQDQAELRRGLRDIETRIDQRMDRMDAKMDGIIDSVSRDFKEQRRFIIGTIIGAIAAAAGW